MQVTLLVGTRPLDTKVRNSYSIHCGVASLATIHAHTTLCVVWSIVMSKYTFVCYPSAAASSCHYYIKCTIYYFHYYYYNVCGLSR